MTSGDTAGFDRSRLTETARQRLATVLDELPAAWQTQLLDALAEVELATLEGWLAGQHLHSWVEHGRRGLSLDQSKNEHLAPAFFGATSQVLPRLSQGDLNEWSRLAFDIGGVDPAQVFTSLPDGLTELDQAERLSCYRLVRNSVYHSPTAAVALYRALPHACLIIPAELRSTYLRCIQAGVSFDPEPLPVSVTLFSSTLRSLPLETCRTLLERIGQLAQFVPTGVARLFRVLGQAYDEVGEQGVLGWITAGEELARRRPEAAEAYFALESRTSMLMLRGTVPAVMLSDVHGVLLKYLHMLGGTTYSLAETETMSFPPPLGAEDEAMLPLPVWVEAFPTYEENFRLLRVMAAQQAGRVACGTYAIDLADLWPSLPPYVHLLLADGAEPPDNLFDFFHLFPQPKQVEALFVHIESKRVAAQLTASYRGLREDLAWAEEQTQLYPAALSMLLPRLPKALWPDLTKDGSADESLLLATELYAHVMDTGARPQAVEPRQSKKDQLTELVEDESARIVPAEDEGPRSAEGLSAEEQAILRKIIARLSKHKKEHRRLQQRPDNGKTFTLFGEPDPEGGDEELLQPKQKKAKNRQRLTSAGVRYVYDEWDFLIDDYRSHWCDLREVPLVGDEGAFFSSTMSAYGDVMKDIKREFQRLRPRLYHKVKGLEDGEEIDLEAAVGARVDLITGVPPSTKIYAARQPTDRDVSALFLLDLSASTDARVPVAAAEGEGESEGEPEGEPEEMRIIDILKESVVLLSSALEEIGDTYAIYGFSSSGRKNVDVYPVKTFVESLSTDVKGRISALAPQRSTRMGTAVRHATRKLKDLSTRGKILILLSDGYPEDADYGREPHTPTYGIRDTMMALREAERSGILSFCITVDKGGHDYLREMCAPSRYMVIEDVLSLPSQLPKIYQRHIRAQEL